MSFLLLISSQEELALKSPHSHMCTISSNHMRSWLSRPMIGGAMQSPLWTSEQASTQEEDSPSVSLLLGSGYRLGGEGKAGFEKPKRVNNKKKKSWSSEMCTASPAELSARTLMTSCEVYRWKWEKIKDEWTVSLWSARTSNGEDESSVSASRIPCTSFLSRFFRSPETSILEVMSPYLIKIKCSRLL